MECGVVAPVIFSFDTVWRRTASTTFRPLYSQTKVTDIQYLPESSGEVEIILSFLEIEHRFFSHPPRSLVTLPSGLARLLINSLSTKIYEHYTQNFISFFTENTVHLQLIDVDWTQSLFVASHETQQDIEREAVFRNVTACVGLQIVTGGL